MPSFELVAQEWTQAEQRAGVLEGGERLAVERVLEAIVAELRRRLGSTFTIDELTALYDHGTGWCLELAYAVAPGAPVAWNPRITTDAAFGRYVREAQDYAGGRRIVAEG